MISARILANAQDYSCELAGGCTAGGAGWRGVKNDFGTRRRTNNQIIASGIATGNPTITSQIRSVMPFSATTISVSAAFITVSSGCQFASPRIRGVGVNVAVGVSV